MTVALILADKGREVFTMRPETSVSDVVDILASNITTGPQMVLIEAGDRAFLTHSCQTWVKLG